MEDIIAIMEFWGVSASEDAQTHIYLDRLVKLCLICIVWFYWLLYLIAFDWSGDSILLLTGCMIDAKVWENVCSVSKGKGCHFMFRCQILYSE